jgi:hypothetical protein
LRSLSNTIIDFDGTLVYENSSRILEDVIFDYWEGRTARFTYELYRGRLALLGRILFVGLYRITRRDGRLWLLLRLSRPLLKAKLPQIVRATAKRLRLHTDLGVNYSRPFTILSTGLEPVIRAFLKLHPELNCTDVLSSHFSAGPGHFSLRLRPIRYKVGAMRHYQPRLYLTDHHHEAALLQTKLRQRYQLRTLKFRDTHSIYKLTLKA